jgi:hypothetical protein
MQSSSSTNGKGTDMTDYAIDVPLDLPNIVHRRKASDPERPVSIADIAKPFVTALAKKYPQRTFVARSARLKGSNILEVSEFAVYESREQLGFIGAGHDYSRWAEGKVRYTITNERIRKTRERGSEAFTRDLNKAIKLVGKMFYTRTHDELFSEALDQAASMLRVKNRDSTIEFDECKATVMGYLMPHILDNFDQFAPIALQQGAPATDVDSLLDKRATARVVRGMCTLLKERNGILVLVRGNDYVADIGNGLTATSTKAVWSTDTLPMHIKKSIGMLKLVEDGYIIEGVGVKINHEAFFVMPEVNHE